jgi:hypothetical protein
MALDVIQIQQRLVAVVAKGLVKWKTAQGLIACRGLISLTPPLLHIRIAFSPYTVAVVCLIHVLYLGLTTIQNELRKFSIKACEE